MTGGAGENGPRRGDSGDQGTELDIGLPCGSAGEESICHVGDLGSIPGVGRSPGEGSGYPLQYSGLENSMDCMVCGVTKSWTQLSEVHTHTHSPCPCIRKCALGSPFLPNLTHGQAAQDLRGCMWVWRKDVSHA